MGAPLQDRPGPRHCDCTVTSNGNRRSRTGFSGLSKWALNRTFPQLPTLRKVPEPIWGSYGGRPPTFRHYQRSALSANHAYETEVGVVKDRRKEGFATNLKRRAIDYFGKEGVSRYYSKVDPSNYKMINLNRLKFGLSAVPDPNGEHWVYSADVVVDVDQERGEP